MGVLETTILQFGLGKFIRSFADLFMTQAEEARNWTGGVAAIQSTDGPRANILRQQNFRYNVLIRGVSNGQQIDDIQCVTSIHESYVASRDWQSILDVASSDKISVILSNTTEVGYQTNATPSPDTLSKDLPPESFPERLLAILRARYRASKTPVTVVPCELLDRNADALKEIVTRLARRSQDEAQFMNWLHGEVRWLNTLVDRITSDPPAQHPLRSEDALLTVTEPFAFWAIERGGPDDGLFDHPSIVRTDDVRSFGLRKVRILNGAHTALVMKAMPMGIETVGEAMANQEVSEWLRDLIFDEIVPTVADKVTDGATFAADCLDRFRNPFLEHKLSSIAWEQDTKVGLRLIPTYHEHISRFGKPPPVLSGLLKGYL